ncbi:LysR family transcriptional regulator [Streptomyces sioyaensis]|uniref:LysR family transcriptional regulator n=1 Tax=Streptomyces sioyaensis TaxID=67364 RepID=A0A4Q1R807_9ACTN|nr:LysR family transcriptional regulator [Streptomyces sioyaensis]MBM4795640.1 LysR family transcriptional regulator [Streptomyces sioyaensis]RXS69494.1 LysR family transcriptional regulator [Streptomyces sioyaensis]
MPYDIDPRLLRAFTAVAEALHFTRAAAGLHVAQQALSRDIRRLEREVGATLFVRSTRQVALTPDGQRLLPYARRVLSAHDELAAAFRPAPERPLLVDVRAPVGTAHRLLAAARERVADSVELVARFHSGLAGAASEVADGRLDVSFGRIAALPAAVRARLSHQPVRLERMAVLLPEEHPLAARPVVPLARLAGETLYAGAGNPRTAEWTELAARLFEGRGIAMAAPFPEIEGSQEFVRVVRKRGWSVLASEEFIEVPGMVLRPLVEPVPLSPVSMVWRRGLRHPGLDALRAAARERAARHGWLAPPDDAWWLPETDARTMGIAA